MAELFDAIARANTVLIDLDRDLWGYISLGYFRQRTREGEIGSSTMPHKVNPIDFENSEGNLGLANALLRHMAEKLPDLALAARPHRFDRAAQHGCGARAHAARLDRRSRRAWTSSTSTARASPPISTPTGRCWPSRSRPSCAATASPNPYEQLKALTRGRTGMTREALHAFIDGLALPADAKARLKALTPSTYIGNAGALARRI